MPASPLSPASPITEPAASQPPAPAPSAPRAAARPGRATWRREVGSGLGLGAATLYLSVIVLIPLAAVVAQAFDQSLSDLWQSISSHSSVKAIYTTLLAALISAAIASVMGTLVAWVLVRDRFPGKALVNALIDLPFAMPSIVVGLALLVVWGPNSPFGLDIAFTRTIVVVALLFITLPFVVRSVQPVLAELDRQAEEAAASLGAGGFTIFRRIILPALRPAILSGAALSFARAIGEIGSLVLITAKVPIASIVIYADIENDSPHAAASLSIVLMAVSLVVLFLIRRVGGRVAH
jgi:sulfate/thiosulfate transport system permease protein